VTVADRHQYSTGVASGSTGSRSGAPSRGGAATHSSDSFGSLLFQDQTDSSENAASAISDGPGSSINGAGAGQEAIVKKSFSPLASLISAETQPSPRHRKGTDESDAAAPASVAQSPALSTAARWILSLTGGEAAVASSPAASSPVFEAQSPAQSSGQASAAPVPTQEAKANPAPAITLDPMENPLGGVENAIAGATEGTVDAMPIAELSLTPTAASANANQATAAKSNTSPALSPESSTPARRQAESDAASQSQGAAGGSAVPEMRLTAVDRGGESSLDQSASRQNAAFAVLKKKAETGSAQSADSTAPLDHGGSYQAAATSPNAIRPAESESTRMSVAAAAQDSPVLEPASTEPAKSSGSSVGTIELQVKVADDKSVGLRFVERQGQVTIQLKSGDLQTAQALSDNLAGLKSSLNENGWDVESRVQARLAPVGQSPGSPASADRGSSPLLQFEASSLPNRASLDPWSTTGNQQARQAADSFGPPQTLRTEQVSTGQMNHQNGSDSSSSHDQPRPDRDGSSGKNGQHAPNESAAADSERQGRRSPRGSAAWLESIESNLTKSSSSWVTTGVRK
jgi:hypothetical protein